MKNLRHVLGKTLGLWLWLGILLWGSPALALQTFADMVGPVQIAAVQSTDPLEVPFITWGGDVATFQGNGGLSTKANSIYANLGLNLKLVPGDDFAAQVRRYLKGESPFLRGTLSMIGMASEVIGTNPDTKGVMFLQMTWSAGDHMVVRETLKTINDLKGKKIVLQQGGPHVGMLDDILRAGKLTWKDVNVVWANDLTGANGAATKFKQDRSIDACFVISPDMVSLVGGINAQGSGAEGTIKGARVLVSTAQMSRSIADVYVVRKDFFDAHRDLVEKFTAGYLQASEALVGLKKAFETKGSSEYRAVLQLAQDIYGKEVLPTLEVDAHGLIADAGFVGLPGNVSFFTDKGNLSGFEAKRTAALDLAVALGYARGKVPFAAADWDYAKLAVLGSLKAQAQTPLVPRFAEMNAADLFPDDPIAKEQRAGNVMLSFVVYFEPNQSVFSATQYGTDFQRAVELASTFGNATMAIGGHGDPTLMLRQMVEAGLDKGILTRAGSGSSAKYSLNGKPFDLTDTAGVLTQIKAGTFANSSKPDPKDTMLGLERLSQERADAVKKAISQFAETKKYRLDVSQMKPVGVGGREPVVAKPATTEEARQNMRVEFRLIKTPAEAIKTSDFDF